MKLINFNDLPYFEFTTDKLDFNNICGDEDIICISFSLKAYCDENFDYIRDIFEERMREFYFEEIWNEGIIDGEFSLIIWNEYENGYSSYRLQFIANGCDIELQIGLNDKEREMLLPIIQKAFGEIFDLNTIRQEVAKTFEGYVSKSIRDKLKLVSDNFVDNGYHSAWITDDNQSCVFANVQDCHETNCPVEIVKFGC